MLNGIEKYGKNWINVIWNHISIKYVWRSALSVFLLFCLDLNKFNVMPSKIVPRTYNILWCYNFYWSIVIGSKNFHYLFLIELNK